MDGTATLQVDRFSVLAVVAVPTQPTTLLTISGRATPNAAVIATVGGSQNFTATADSEGRYSVDINGGDPQDIVSIRARGTVDRGQDTIELATYLDTIENLISQAGDDAVLEAEDNRATVLSSLTTARYVLVNAVVGGAPSDRASLAAADRNIDSSPSLMFSDMAAIIQQVVDNPNLLAGTSSTTLSFAADRDDVVAYAYANSSEGLNGFLNLSALRANLFSKAELFEPAGAPPTDGRRLVLSSLTKNNIVPVRGGSSIVFETDGTGRELQLRVDQISSQNIALPFTWSNEASGALVVNYDQPTTSFAFLTEDDVVRLLNGPSNEEAIRAAYRNLSDRQFRTEIVRTTYTQVPGPIGAQFMVNNSVLVYRFAEQFATAALTVSDVEEPLESFLSVWQQSADIAATAFTDAQLRNQTWAIRLVGPSAYAGFFAGYNLNDDIVGHCLLTFNDNQTAVVQAGGAFTIPYVLNWSILPNGALRLTYPDGREQRFTIVAASRGAFGLLSELDTFGETYVEYASAVRTDSALSVSATDLITSESQYWMNTINAAFVVRPDVSLPARWERFGFQFTDATSVNRMVGPYDGTSFENVEEFWSYEVSGDRILINAYTDEFGFNSPSCPGAASCIIWRQRQWVPLRQEGNLLHVLEWDKRWPTGREAQWDAASQTWRRDDGSPVDDSIFSWIFSARINAYFITNVAE